MSAARVFRHVLSTALLISFLPQSTSLAEPSGSALVGTMQCAYYVHPSASFRIMTLSPEGISDSQAGATFTHTFMGSIDHWNDVAFVSPELSADSPDEVLDAMIVSIQDGLYAKKKQKPSIASREIWNAFGRECLHAKVYYPEYPGTGVTTFNSKGKQVAADVVAQLDVIPVSGLSSSKTGLPIRYVLAGTMVVTPLDRGKDEGQRAHLDFLRHLEFTSPAGITTYDPADTAHALWRAAAAGDVPGIERLLASGANVNAADDAGVTPLIIASQAGCADAVRTLLAKAADLDTTANATCVVVAAWSGHADVLILLLEHGFRVDAVHAKTGDTALLSIAGTNDVAMARVLLDHGADAELRRSAEPLMRATLNNRVEMVKLFIERGANVNLKDEHGKSALDCASGPMGRNKTLEKILKQAGAK